jgi:hypothetical protein
MRYIIIALLLISSSVFAEEQVKEVDPKFEGIGLLELDNLSEQELDQLTTCVEQGTNPKTCHDPDWCLYPSAYDTKECKWYREST